MLHRQYHIRLYQSHQNNARLQFPTKLPYSLKAKPSVDVVGQFFWSSFAKKPIMKRRPSSCDQCSAVLHDTVPTTVE